MIKEEMLSASWKGPPPPNKGSGSFDPDENISFIQKEPLSINY